MECGVSRNEGRRKLFIDGGGGGSTNLAVGLVNPTLGPLGWCSFLVLSCMNSKQNMVPNSLNGSRSTKCKNKSEWSTLKDEICYDIWVPSVGP
jgi:hypothetical protein